MNIHLIGHQLEVTPALKTFTQEKFHKLERHYDKITAINVVLRIEHLNQIAEATILVAKGELHADASSEDMYVAIDNLVDKLDRQLIKHKEKKRNH